MTTTYRPIVTPAFMLAESVWEDFDNLPHRIESAMWADRNREPHVHAPVDTVMAIHAARAEVLGELERIQDAFHNDGSLVHVRLRLLTYAQALRASLDDPEEGSA